MEVTSTSGGNSYAPQVQLPIVLDEGMVETIALRRHYHEVDNGPDGEDARVAELVQWTKRQIHPSLHSRLDDRHRRIQEADAEVERVLTKGFTEIEQLWLSARTFWRALWDVIRLPLQGIGRPTKQTAPSVSPLSAA